jgi:hypothetical protein
MKQNITLDFTVNQTLQPLLEDMPLAIMPAELAKKLLRMYEKQLIRTRPQEIISSHIENLKRADSVSKAEEISLNWILERELIKNVTAENWDAYAVNQPEVVREPIGGYKEPEAVCK